MAQNLSNKLTATFIKRSIWITIILCTILSATVPAVIYYYHLHQYRLESAEILKTFIDKDLCFRPADLMENERSRNAIVERIDVFMEFGNLVEFKLWAKDGVLVYSYRSKELIGHKFPDNQKLAETLTTGTIRSEIEKTPESDSLHLLGKGPLVEVYVPILVDGQIEGAAEAYRLAPKFKLLKTHIALVVSIAVIIFLLLYLLLAGQFKRAAQELVDYDAKLCEAFKGLGHSYIDTIRSLSKALELRDMETEGHCERVVALAVLIGEKLHLSREKIDQLILGSYLHDIGKIGVSDSILLKPGALDTEERIVVQTHVPKGIEIIKNIDFLKLAAEVVLNHHERWDGKGYPNGLKGEEIPIAARIFSLVDVFDALTSDRPYRKAMPFQKAREIIQSERGLYFDPVVVEIFLELTEQDIEVIKHQVGKIEIYHAVDAAVENLLREDQRHT